jgi:hypothetical protein
MTGPDRLATPERRPENLDAALRPKTLDLLLRTALKMRALLKLPIVIVAAGSAVGPAWACTDGGAMESYFSYQPPARHGDTPMLRVTIDRIEGNVVRAQLVGPFAQLSDDGNVTIGLPVIPIDGMCLRMGPVDGPVYVIGTLIRTHSGQLSLEAVPTPSPPRRRMNSRAAIDGYIVDPAYLGKAQ